ncbi:hypothetical protein KL86DES1_22101 [uncultured Desulfovibrio sp.]|uniref:Uncharacterized protein n=1 Tax=uncultured Desulfovibrio sp. TaxID=167968 RepID=A0A212LB30_9BACT|nr:hypothetical protein KL86DES1_22101 [uncultured Desulfovibrio sp.]VZH34995.1 conserved protein of unknown function [Desulfovibrio sp. 86]
MIMPEKLLILAVLELLIVTVPGRAPFLSCARPPPPLNDVWVPPEKNENEFQSPSGFKWLPRKSQAARNFFCSFVTYLAKT